MKKTYFEKQEELRQEAIDWQIDASNRSMSWGEVSEATEYFYKKAKRYGLVKEFKINCII